MLKLLAWLWLGLFTAGTISGCSEHVQSVPRGPDAYEEFSIPDASLMQAVQSGNPDQVREALEAARPHMNHIDAYTRRTALQQALQIPPAYRAQIVTMLLEAGADPNLTENGNMPPISLAAANNDVAIMQKLKAAGADLHKGDSADASPLLYAAANNAREAVDYLLGEGERVNRPDRHGLYPIDHALTTGQAEMADYLRSLGGLSALDAVKTKADAQELMKQAKAEESQGFLELQVVYNNVFLTKLMLQAGYPLSAPMEALIPELAKDGRIAMLKTLLEAGADPAIRVGGKTALEEATKNGDQETIHLLLHYGAALSQSQRAAMLPFRTDMRKPVLPDEVLKIGSEGSGVQAFQHILLQLGESIPGGADGRFGQQTMEALQSFQRKHYLDDDGIYGPSTQEMMKQLLHNLAPSCQKAAPASRQ
ncbi:ankyrin repeat domain-containing protein [Paenibacillus sp. y28]|uniref:ankyrin repeat domain-containing protein n=1 Tax=Paenibacillus sp. y28 TaxID=3129110 RepID=UPI003017E490